MLHITARNVNDAYAEALWKMKVIGVPADTRNGKVWRAPFPVCTTFRRPRERMLFDAKRDANPFFHIMESIWMLAGRNDVEFVSKFSSNIAQFSDDGQTYNGAYGWRWRNQWDIDQIVWVIDHLTKYPTSRRAVISMWDPARDPYAIMQGTKDVPCNTAIYFNPRGNTLDMTVTNRSNDIIWGCYGANAVHMSMLHEFVAFASGFLVGNYHQFSNDWHIYDTHWHLMESPPNPDDSGEGYPRHPMVSLTYPDGWDLDINEMTEWCIEPDGLYQSQYINMVLNPMLSAWEKYKEGDLDWALIQTDSILDSAIYMACRDWLRRRKAKREQV